VFSATRVTKQEEEEEEEEEESCTCRIFILSDKYELSLPVGSLIVLQ